MGIAKNHSMNRKNKQNEYVCENCWSEQENSGECETCELKGVHSIVSPVEQIMYLYGEEKGKQNDVPLELFDDYPPVNDADGNITYLDPIQLDQYSKGGSNPYALMDDDMDDYQYYGTAYKGTKISSDFSSKFNYGNSKSYDLTQYSNGGNYKSHYRKTPPRKAKTWRDNTFWFIGDVHGNIEEYQKAIKDIRLIDPTAITIQVGDLDLGQYKLPKLGDKDWFIQGNHDDIDACLKHPNFMGKYGYKDGVFFMGGAKTQKLGYKNEELSEKDLDAAIQLYIKTKPEIVVTHDCPDSLRKSEFGYSHKLSSRTNQALEEMWKIHAPNVWAFGHYHVPFDDNIDGCEFICVAPLESHQIRLGWVSGVKERQKPSKSMEMTTGKFVDKLLGNMNPFK